MTTRTRARQRGVVVMSEAEEKEEEPQQVSFKPSLHTERNEGNGA